MLKVWENLPWYTFLQAVAIDEGIAMTGVWSSTQYGIEVTDATVRLLDADETNSLLTGSSELQERQLNDWKDICQLVESIRDPRLSILCKTLLNTHEKKFRRAAAARSFHHARRGGLVEHTAGVMRCVAVLCSAYPGLNRDLLLAGALFHDCGKIWENGYPEHGFSMPYSDAGELLGHISLGIEIINKLWTGICTEEQKEAWKTLTPPSEQVRLHLLHMVASHHGSQEFGSPVVPKTPEAFVLHYADDLDAKLEMMRGAYESSPQLSVHLRQRKQPLPGNVADPLPSVSDSGATKK